MNLAYIAGARHCSCWAPAGWWKASMAIARDAMGVSELVIGLTIVAAGTSLPEVVDLAHRHASRGARHRRRQRRRQQHLQHPGRCWDSRRCSSPGGVAVAPAAARLRHPGDAGRRRGMPARSSSRATASRAGKAGSFWAVMPPTRSISSWMPASGTTPCRRSAK
ncbi:MAG: hypothetical protein MZV70_71305 [Desulfobacterales bacterium]|nr:hypothetical protein [Desulfobacterales bacterium]